MKTTLLLVALVLFTWFCYSKTPENIFLSYKDAIEKIDLVSYNVVRIDSFTNGEVWDNHGKCTLIRNSDDDLLGFSFFGERADIPKSYLFDGTNFFTINPGQKTYEVSNDITRGILGSPGGQLVVEELLSVEDDYIKYTVLENDSAYILNFDFPDIPKYFQTKRNKKIYLDKVSYIPFRIHQTVYSLGKKYVSIKVIDKLIINETKVVSNIFDKTFIQSFSPLVVESGEEQEDFLGKPAATFTAKDIVGNEINLDSYSGKILLLDFWEPWCAPCIGSLPEVVKLYQKYKKAGLQVIGITSDENTLEQAKEIVEKLNITFPTLIGNNYIKKLYGVIGVPRYILIGKDGKISYVSDGFKDSIFDLLSKEFGY